MRLFTAITLPEEVKDTLYASARRIKNSAESGNFSHSGNFHITLVFHGETKADDIGGLKKVIDEAACIFPPLYLKCGSLGYFQKKNRKILYFDVGGGTALLNELQLFLYNGFYKRGFCEAQNKYTPHITFAREVKIEKLPEINQSIPFAAGEVTLMHSTRADGRLTYIPIYRAPFSGECTLDRVEEGIAVCESEKGKFFNIPGVFLPKGVSSGSKMRYNGLNFGYDGKKTKAKTDVIRDKFQKEIRKP